MNELPAPKVRPFPSRNQLGKSWPEIAAVFQARADRERELAWEHRAHSRRHMTRAEALDEAATFYRGQDGGNG